MATTKKKATKKKTAKKKAKPAPEPEVVVEEEVIEEEVVEVPVPPARMLRFGRGVPRGQRHGVLKRWAKKNGLDPKTVYKQYL
jgi:hypothetical protein